MRPQRSHTPLSKEVGKYVFRLNEVIGTGFSSTVFRGLSKEGGQACAIKVVMDQTLSPFKRRLLENEIKSYSLSSHPNLLRCLDVYSTKNNHYIVTQLCEGGSLAQLLHRKVIPEREVVDYLSQLVDGLIELRRFGYLHRDIKCSNLLLQNGTLKIGDFGFACPEHELEGQLKHQNVGTPAYMAPEAILDNKYSQKSEVFAVGVVGFQLLTGRLPWFASSEKELAKRMRSSSANWAGWRGNEESERLVRSCLEGEASLRPGLGQVRESLNKLVSKASEVTQA